MRFTCPLKHSDGKHVLEEKLLPMQFRKLTGKLSAFPRTFSTWSSKLRSRSPENHFREESLFFFGHWVGTFGLPCEHPSTGSLNYVLRVQKNEPNKVFFCKLCFLIILWDWVKFFGSFDEGSFYVSSESFWRKAFFSKENPVQFYTKRCNLKPFRECLLAST